MGNRKKYIIIGLIILMVLLAAWKLLMLTVFKSYAGASGERKEEPILAVYDYNGQLKSNDLNGFKHVFIRWNDNKEEDAAKLLSPVLTNHQPVLITVEI